MNQNISRLSDTPIEDYNRDLLEIRTFEHLKEFEEKYSVILDDAAAQIAAVTADTFPDFISQLSQCFDGFNPPSDYWLSKYGTIPAPTLFIQLMPYTLESNMGSGVVMNQLLDENIAEIRNGKYHFLE